MSGSRKDKNGRVLRTGESQRKDGRYIYQYTDTYQNRKVVYANSLGELREKEKEITKDQLDGIRTYCGGKATLNFVFDRYIATKVDLKLNTKTNYTYMYDKYVRNGFGKKVITDIHYSDIKFFYLELMNEIGLQATTVDTIHTVLHPTFQMALRDNIIRVNPTDGVMAEIKKQAGKNKGIRHSLTKEQQKAFLDYVENNPVYSHWLPLFTVLFGTGCRIGEIIGLRWDDIDLEKKEISINHGLIYLAQRKEKARFMISTPKTENSTRVIPMMTVVKEAFEAERERQKLSGFNQDVIDGYTGFIFTNKDGKTLNPAAINKAIVRIYTAYNAEEIIKATNAKRRPVLIPHFSCHIIRHTFSTRLCECETNLKAIQSIMGHASIQTTMDIYAEATKERNLSAMQSFESENFFN